MNPLAAYLKDLNSALAKGNATEHTYRSSFQTFIEAMGTGLTATNEPRHIACGAPDFILTKGHTPLGYVETKDIGVALDREEKSKQMGHYLGFEDLRRYVSIIASRWRNPLHGRD